VDYDRRTAARAVLYLCVFPTDSLFISCLLRVFISRACYKRLLLCALRSMAVRRRPHGSRCALPPPGCTAYYSSRVRILISEGISMGSNQARLLRATSGPTSSRGSSHSPAMAVRQLERHIKSGSYGRLEPQVNPPLDTLLYSLQHIGSSIGYHGAF